MGRDELYAGAGHIEQLEREEKKENHERAAGCFSWVTLYTIPKESASHRNALAIRIDQSAQLTSYIEGHAPTYCNSLTGHCSASELEYSTYVTRPP